MERFCAKVYVNIKPEIKDIKALTLKQAVDSLISVDKLKCTMGNFYTLDFEAKNFEDAQVIVDNIAQEILSNSVIEEYRVEWQ